MKEYSTACPRNCYCTCSLKVWVENDKVKKIDPHKGNFAVADGVCVKGQAYVERANSVDRILYPLKKKEDKFVRISWDEAFDTIVDKLQYYKKKHGSHSIMYYAASGMSGLLNSFSSSFWKQFGGATTTFGNMCWPAGLEATRLTLGENKHNIPWDLENAQLIILWGKNPAETNVQQMVFIENAQQKGAKLIVVDPRRTISCERADLLVQPMPGTDAALALAIANVMIAENLIDVKFISINVLGFEVFKKHVVGYTPEWAEKITSVPKEVIIRLAYLIGERKPMTIVPGYGMQRYSNGGQTTRAILALQILTGNIGKVGACWHYANLQSYIFDHVKEPLSYFPNIEEDKPFRRAVSVAKLGEDMLAQNDPELKMIWVERGNPLTQNPNTNKNLEAFRKLEFKVVIEEFMTDTALEADIILPAKNMFEQSDIIGSYWNPYVQLKQKVVEPAGEVKPETEIYWELAHRLNWSEELIHDCLLSPGDKSVDVFLQNKLNDFSLSLDELKENPLLAPGLEEIAFSDLKFNTPSGKIELYSEEAKKLWGVNALPTYEALNNIELSNPNFPFYLMTPNTKNRIHSQFGNLKVMKHIDPEPLVFINPTDAEMYGVEHNEMVKVFNDRGEVSLMASFDFSLKHGCLVIHNGWWEQEGCSVNKLSAHMETDMGYGTAFHDNRVGIKPVIG